MMMLISSISYCQIDGDFIIKDKESRTIKKDGNAFMMYVDNVIMGENSKLVLDSIILYVNKNIRLSATSNLKLLNNSKVYYKGSSNALSKNIIKLGEKIRIKDINILSKYPNSSFSIMLRGEIILKGTYNEKKDVKLSNDLYDIWVQKEGFLNNVLLTTFKL